MIWYKIKDHWWIDVTQIRSFDVPNDCYNSLRIQYKDGTEDTFGIPIPFSAVEECKRLVEFFETIKHCDTIN
jgi:hypothetical protein